MFHSPYTTEEYPKTREEIVAAMVEHLKKQGSLAIVSGELSFYRYRNLACVAGCLIPDSLYRKDFEQKEWFWVQEREHRLKTMYEKHCLLIEDAQRIHDDLDYGYDCVEDVEEVCQRIEGLLQNPDLGGKT